jgi:hypothetical protein
MMSTAEISDIKVDNVTDPEKPFTYNYKVRVPNYAQKTGKRMFFQPGFFEYGKGPLFSSATRKYDIFFHYPWSEEDKIEIALPVGYTLDSADAPAPINDPGKIASLEIVMATTANGSVMRYDRKFFFGGKGNYLFSRNSYEAIKAYFDAFSKADSHSITLKQK